MVGEGWIFRKERNLSTCILPDEWTFQINIGDYKVFGRGQGKWWKHPGWARRAGHKVAKSLGIAVDRWRVVE